MPLVACPDCQQSVSTAAAFCIHCGRPMAAAPAAPAPAPPAWSPTNAAPDRIASSKQIATIIYALQAAAFLYGVTGLVALVLGYVKRGEAERTWLESHFDWQINTFWGSVLWAAVTFIVALVLGVGGGSEAGAILGGGAAIVSLLLLWGWNIYRVVRGWMRLSADQPVP